MALWAAGSTWEEPGHTPRPTLATRVLWAAARERSEEGAAALLSASVFPSRKLGV